MTKWGVVGANLRDDFADNIADTLQRMDIPVEALGSASLRGRGRFLSFALGNASRLARVESMLQSRLLRRCEEAGVEILLTVEPLSPETVTALATRGVKVVLWFPDAVSNLGRQTMFLAPYEAIFLKQPKLVDMARRFLDSPVHYLPEACNSRWHVPPKDVVPTDRHILLAGNMYPFRLRLLERLNDAGIPLAIYGPRWATWLPKSELRDRYRNIYLRGLGKASAFRSAAAVLNTLHPAEIDGYNVRLFEAAGCGGVTITEERPILGDFFEPGTEVLTYRDFDSLVEVCRSALEDPSRWLKIADAGSRRAHEEHTYEHRLNEIFRFVI